MTKELSVIQKDPNATLISFVDKDFVKWLQQQGWIVALGSTSGIITEKGLAATELSYNPSYYGTQWTSLEGIENFTNLEKINVMSNDLRNRPFRFDKGKRIELHQELWVGLD